VPVSSGTETIPGPSCSAPAVALSAGEVADVGRAPALVVDERERVVLAGEHWTAFVPFAARWPVEVHLAPHRDVPDLPALTSPERNVASMSKMIGLLP